MFRRMTRERYLSDPELARFMAVVRERRHVHQARDYALFSLLANTGMRPAEARALVRGDFHISARLKTVVVRRVQKKHGPRHLPRLFLQRPVAEIVARYLATLPEDPNTKLFPFTKRQSARLFHYYGDKAGILPKRKIYALRHTVGMRLWRHTGDLRIIQAIMGYTNQQGTAGYVHTSPETIRAAYAAAGPVR